MSDEGCYGSLSIYWMEGTKVEITDFYLYVSLKSSNLFLGMIDDVPYWIEASFLVTYFWGIYFTSGKLVIIVLFILGFIDGYWIWF